MKNRLCHIAPLIFLCLLLLPLLSMIALQGAQWYLQDSAAERMEHHQLVSLSLPVEKAVWHKKGKELSINGRLFDVKQSSFSNGILMVIGFFDDEETSLAGFLFRLVRNGKNAALLQFFLLLQCFATTLLLFSFASAGKQKPVHYAGLSFYFPQPFCLIEEQPPQG